MQELEKEFIKKGKRFPNQLLEELTIISRELSENYPDDLSFVLPTNLGNAIRAFEVYPRVMYGLEGINGWTRILAVIPKDFRELIDSAKAQVDWWLNIQILSFLFLIEFLVSMFFINGWTTDWVKTILNLVIPSILFFAITKFTSWRAVKAAIGWGEYVKTAFDLYRFDLVDKLGFKVPITRASERTLWDNYSHSILFRLPNDLPETRKKSSK